MSDENGVLTVEQYRLLIVIFVASCFVLACIALLPFVLCCCNPLERILHRIDFIDQNFAETRNAHQEHMRQFEALGSRMRTMDDRITVMPGRISIPHLMDEAVPAIRRDLNYIMSNLNEMILRPRRPQPQQQPPTTLHLRRAQYDEPV